MKQRKKTRRQRPKPFPPDELLLVYADETHPSKPEDFFNPPPPTLSAGTASAEAAKPVVTSKSILRYIALHQGVNTPALARFFVKTLKTIGRFTTELRYRDFIEFRGSLNKGGYFLKPAGLQFLEHPEESAEFSPTRMTAELVYRFIQENPGANHFAIAAHFQRTIKSATRHTQRLRLKKKIIFRGTPRDGGFYAVRRNPRKNEVRNGDGNAPATENGNASSAS